MEVLEDTIGNSIIANDKNDTTTIGRPKLPTAYHFSRRMSGIPILSATENNFPIQDKEMLSKFDELIQQFPKPPTNLEPSRVSTSSRGSTSSTTSTSSTSSSWGFKGIAERFNLFSKS